MQSRLWSERLALLVVILGALVLYWTAPKGGAFYWSDAPRHALNGVFIKDLLRDLPLADPAGYAYGYYAQYPALTILFYPPLFYVLSAPLYAMFGVSHETALLAITIHYVAFGWGCYRLARLWIGPGTAAAFAVTTMFVPEIAFWGRQVMLEVPAFAFAVWSAYFFVRHLREGRFSCLVWATALLILAMYTKISVGFIAIAFALALLQQRGIDLLHDRKFWLVCALGLLALLPLVVLTLMFGQANVQSVSGVADRVASRSSLAGWLWYARQWPGQYGWPLAVAIAMALTYALAKRRSIRLTPEQTFWFVWFGAGYLFFSAIDLKEARHSVYVLLPPLLAAFVTAEGLRKPFAAVFSAGLVLCSVGWTLTARPVFYVDGYSVAAKFIAEHAPPKTMVLFSGYRDGSFVFNMRAQETRPDLHVLRADKLLLRVAVRRELGVEQRSMSEGAIRSALDELAVHYLVVQPGFWDDLEVMRRFETVVAGYTEVARIKTPANFPAHEAELIVYRNPTASATLPPGRTIELPIIGRSINSTGERAKQD